MRLRFLAIKPAVMLGCAAGWCKHPANLQEHPPDELFWQLLFLPIDERMQIASWGVLHAYVQLALK